MAPEHVPSLRGRATITTVIVVVVLIALCLVAWVYRNTPPLSNLLGSGQASLGTPIATANYLCDGGKTITASYFEDVVTLKLTDGSAMTVPHAMSASGARYANKDESFVFWNKGNTAFVEEKGKQTYTGCIEVSARTSEQESWKAYASSKFGFSILYPMDYTADASYQYQAMGPGLEINGVKFTIPTTMATGTNLSSDTYVSVEQLSDATACSASLFLDDAKNPGTVTENSVEYSVATGGGAGAGNLYEEIVYAIPGTMPCTAIRYMIHSTQLANYPAGTRTAFDHAALVAQFDQIRRTLILGR
ncbi:MliC family protein [Patescibacteria group bacterium]|nr:MliC family protein [Patescibacteria group bacterium]